MADGWNYDTCFMCKRFSTGRTVKGRYFRCKLNNNSAAEKRTFYMIWAVETLISYGVMDENQRDVVAVDYVGKKKREKG